jgi:hypothetical protein
MTEKRRYTQEEADRSCSEFYELLSADKIKLVVPPMLALVDAIPKVQRKGEHVDMGTISDDTLQQMKSINLGVRNAPTI